MGTNARSRIAVACLASSRGLAPGVRAGLESLGYRLVMGRSLALAGRSEAFQPAARIVEEGQLAKLPLEARDPVPVIVLKSGRSAACDDPRVIGVLEPPAELRSLYALLQSALERHPRGAPRVRTALPAKAMCGERGWPGAILSLSERGCLLRSRWRSRSRRDVDLWFALPAEGLIHVKAEPRQQDGLLTGFAFREPSDDTRAAIAAFVSEVLSR